MVRMQTQANVINAVADVKSVQVVVAEFHVCGARAANYLTSKIK